MMKDIDVVDIVLDLSNLQKELFVHLIVYMNINSGQTEAI